MPVGSSRRERDLFVQPLAAPGKWHAVSDRPVVEALWGEIATVVRLIEREFSGKAVLHVSSSGR
jgi:hypothetical protein